MQKVGQNSMQIGREISSMDKGESQSTATTPYEVLGEQAAKRLINLFVK